MVEPYQVELARILFFFFQAEDGIRDKLVTGVQTCALPISCKDRQDRSRSRSIVHPRSRSILSILTREWEGVMPITLTQQTALITGASRGIEIGRASCRERV